MKAKPEAPSFRGVPLEQSVRMGPRYYFVSGSHGDVEVSDHATDALRYGSAHWHFHTTHYEFSNSEVMLNG